MQQLYNTYFITNVFSQYIAQYYCNFIIIFLFIITAATLQQNFGKVNITERSPDGFFCDTVQFLTPFQNGGTIRVFPTLSHEDHPGRRNEASVAIVTSVNQTSFSICLTEPEKPRGKMTLNLFAFSDAVLPQGILTGSVSVSLFTSGSSCNDVTFSRVSFHKVTGSNIHLSE